MGLSHCDTSSKNKYLAAAENDGVLDQYLLTTYIGTVTGPSLIIITIVTKINNAKIIPYSICTKATILNPGHYPKQQEPT